MFVERQTIEMEMLINDLSTVRHENTRIKEELKTNKLAREN
jgi:hypothetical protein